MTRRYVSAAITAIATAASASPAWAGAPNYTCRFGTLTIVADVHRDTGMVQSAPGRPVVRYRVTHSGNGGDGFGVARRGEDIEVRLIDIGDRWPLHGIASTFVKEKVGSPRDFRRGVCSALDEAPNGGLLSNNKVAVRTRPAADAPRLTSAALPFVWRSWSPGPTPEWWKVTVWEPEGRKREGFVRRGDVVFFRS